MLQLSRGLVSKWNVNFGFAPFFYTSLFLLIKNEFVVCLLICGQNTIILVEKALGTSFHNHLIPQFVAKRHQMGISQMELDERIGVARGLVSKWEVGIRKPSGFLFCVWADALGCEMWLKEKS